MTISLSTLNSNNNANFNIDAAKQAGFTLIGLEAGWNVDETADGTFSASVDADYTAFAQRVTSHGMKVNLHPGLHLTPSWVSSQTCANFLNQDSKNPVTYLPNLVFSQLVRKQAEAYLSHLIGGVVPLSQIGVIRSHEIEYPGMTAADGGAATGTNVANQYWGSDAIAQQTGHGGGSQASPTSTTRPTNIGDCPFIGWAPGAQGSLTSHSQVGVVTGTAVQGFGSGTWLDWYVGALADMAAWYINAIKQTGYTGIIAIDIAGQGSPVPEQLSLINAYLSGSGASGSLGRGAAWNRFCDKLSGYLANPPAAYPSLNSTNVMLYCSSVAESSTFSNDVYASSDQNTPYSTYVNGVDTTMGGWSSQRLIAYQGIRLGLLLNGGENPGPGGVGSVFESESEAFEAARMVNASGGTLLAFAHDSDLAVAGNANYDTFARINKKYNLVGQRMPVLI